MNKIFAVLDTDYGHLKIIDETSLDAAFKILSEIKTRLERDKEDLIMAEKLRIFEIDITKSIDSDMERK